MTETKEIAAYRQRHVRPATHAAGRYTGPVTAEAERLLQAALRLPDAERAQLAAILADSVGDDASEADIERAWVAEARRRLEDVRSGTSETIPWEDVRTELHAVLAGARSRQASAR